jgi:site-specific DNA-cytosine methylase
MPNNPGVVGSVSSKWSKGTGGPAGDEHYNLLVDPIVIDRSAFNQGENAQYTPIIKHDSHMPSLVSRGPHAVAIQGNLIGREDGGPWGVGASEGGPMYTLTKNDVHAVAFRKSKRAQSNTDHETWIDDGLSNTLNGFDTGDTRTTHIVATPMIVRRLTPTECERLQGFPDGWTQVGTDSKPTADSNRYKQLGNAVTVNVAEWIARRVYRCL